MKKLGIVGILFASIVFGALWMSLTTEEEFVLVQPKVTERVPAALQDSGKLRHLQDQIIKVPSKNKIWEKLAIRNSPTMTVIELPHVALMDPSGENNLACLIFDQVSLTFLAEGQATSGERTALELSAPCEFDLDQPEILEVLTVPSGELLKLPTAENKFLLDSHPGYTFELKNAAGEWPTVWTLTEISYRHREGSFEVLRLPPLNAASEPPPTMVW